MYGEIDSLGLTRVVALSIILAMGTSCTQLPSTSIDQDAAYPAGEGTTVFIDEGHNNFHTMNGRYRPFADVLERDGYIVKPYDSEFNPEALAPVEILVISNALNERNVGNWTLPCPSAFTYTEIRVVVDWVAHGGSLFLIADHMPFAGAAAEMAKAFGFKFTNGFAVQKYARGPSRFSVDDRTLAQSVVTLGRSQAERVEEVYTFTGQAFLTPLGARPILVFDDDHVNHITERAWQFSGNTRSLETKGWCQGAFMQYGRGRIVVFGEAAMFRLQRAGSQNYQLLLNLIHWMDGLLDEETDKLGTG